MKKVAPQGGTNLQILHCYEGGDLSNRDLRADHPSAQNLQTSPAHWRYSLTWYTNNRLRHLAAITVDIAYKINDTLLLELETNGSDATIDNDQRRDGQGQANSNFVSGCWYDGQKDLMAKISP